MDIRKLLDFITEAEKPLASGMKVMSPAEFVQSQGIEPKSSEEDVSEDNDTIYKNWRKDVGTDYDTTLKLVDKDYNPNKPRNVADELAKMNKKLKGVAEGLNEMDKSAPQPGRDGKVSHSTYGSRDKKGSDYFKGKEAPGKPVNAKQMSKDALDILKKQGVAEDLDEAEKLKGVSQRPLPKDELISYLDRVVGEPVTDKKTGKPKLDKKGNPVFKSLKTKTDKYKYPYIHRSNVPIVNDNGKKYDLDKLAAMFSERPEAILKQNEKMQHSDGTASQFYNVGLPALVGLAVDEDTNEFVVVNTCPGAGQCKLVCYAMKGGYVQWKASSLGQTRMLNFLYNDPDGFMGKLEGEIAKYAAKNSKKKIKTIIRWHDAGDFFAPEYLSKAYELAKKFPDVEFYAYTKLASVAKGNKPDNFIINFSMGAQPSQEKQIDFAKTKNSRIVPEVIFADALVKDKNDKWQYKSPQAQQAVKDRIAHKYSLDPKSIITYDEMMKMPVSKDAGEKGKWNVIVKPGDGDDAANRHDVLSSLLLIH